MLAPRNLPTSYKIWNKKWLAPYGRELRGERFLRKMIPENLLIKIKGPFSIQPNNDTRKFEYPWAYEVGGICPNLRVLDLGGGLSGFQFALDAAGAKVFNVDPGSDAKGKGWPCSPESMSKLNQIFNTSVTLLSTTLPDAALDNDSFDRVFCLSVLEHFTKEEFETSISEIHRVLRPGGYFVLTADLFLDLLPFTTREVNEWGRNYPVGSLFTHSGFKAVVGTKSQVYGCEEFNADHIQSNLSNFLVGGFYPVLVQCLVFQKLE